MPYYPSLRELPAVARAVPGAIRAIWRGLAQVDAIWVFGPYPFSLVFVVLGLLRRKRVILGVRQDAIAYYRSRLPSRAAAPVLAPLWLLEAAYRVLARWLPATAVGAQIAGRYGGTRAGLLEHTVSLTPAREVAAGYEPPDWSGELRLLAVGRLEPEKTPLVLVEALAELERLRPGRFRLTWAGSGRLAEAVRARADELGVGARLDLPGYVPYGPRLLELYRDAHLFVHTALTEGVPQVVLEAMAAGTPVVATDVGGVSAAVDGGAAGLLVPPADRHALVRAVLRLTDDADLRRRCAEAGLVLARQRTLEAEAGAVARFLGGGA
jgi:glycosyltransferase involved in cell wall biosynthesis